jgi:hypothetical protein
MQAASNKVKNSLLKLGRRIEILRKNKEVNSEEVLSLSSLLRFKFNELKKIDSNLRIDILQDICKRKQQHIEISLSEIVL